MQSKVSMVMPCYNKVKYIGEMFDSILAQEWNNIELILVNDGSTDGTREVITEYEPRFRERGFEVVIEDQRNAGVCAAAKAGLALATGDYVCMIDSDDELDPKYVSTMAGWLEDHPDYDYCICDAVLYTGSGTNKAFKPTRYSNLRNEEPLYTERYLLTDIRSEVWVYLARAEYLKKCKIIETYFTDTKGSHEPGYIIPLSMYGGKYKYFPLPLYRFNVGDIGHSRHEKYKQAEKFYEEYHRLCKIAIDHLPSWIANFNRKQNLSSVSLLSKHIHMYEHAKKLAEESDDLQMALDQLVDSLNRVGGHIDLLKRSNIMGKEDIFIDVIKSKVLGSKPSQPLIRPKGRVVGYGALGKAFRSLIPSLKNTPIEPMELWDRAGNGSGVLKPDFSSLTKEDLVLVFPMSEQVQREVQESVPCKVWSNLEIKTYLFDRMVSGV